MLVEEEVTATVNGTQLSGPEAYSVSVDPGHGPGTDQGQPPSWGLLWRHDTVESDG